MKKILLFLSIVLSIAAIDPMKGVGCDGACNANTIERLQVTWFYNWGTQSKFGSTVQFVPMCWGASHISSLPGYSSHLLGFNEPDHPKQANISPQNAANIWIELSKRSYLVVSPAMASNVVAANSWMEQFFKASPTPKVDYIAVHHYGANVTRLKEYLTDIYNDKVFNYKPIWLT